MAVADIRWAASIQVAGTLATGTLAAGTLAADTLVSPSVEVVNSQLEEAASSREREVVGIQPFAGRLEPMAAIHSSPWACRTPEEG